MQVVRAVARQIKKSEPLVDLPLKWEWRPEYQTESISKPGYAEQLHIYGEGGGGVGGGIGGGGGQGLRTASKNEVTG